ncbi:MAG: GAF domain-containing sensor histidine kinase [Kaiparowitsia implicata GSE-PSE-MK54-09C]|jgi:signal transduction histidine kinase|nr:GAF domain-containing sensor histidine kinase [Kaiparowitsia implicata GSE-PSE-MK54-09C]
MPLPSPEYLRSLCHSDAAFQKLQAALADGSCDRPLEQQRLLFRVITKIRESLDLDEIFKTTAQEVRQLLQADRVGVFYFFPGYRYTDGEFVSEDVAAGFESAMAAKIHDHCFGEQHAVHYTSGRMQAVADIYAAGLKPCHIEVLAQFQIRANLVVPLLLGGNLWGLLCIHQCAAPRQWQPQEIEFVQQIATHLGVAIQQAELFQQVQRQTTELTAALTQLQQAQAHLVQSEKMSSLGQLVAGIAHEINNPVNFISGNLSHATQYAGDLMALLRRYQHEHTQPSPGLSQKLEHLDLEFILNDFPKMLSSMQVGAERIQHIVRSLRNFSRLDEAIVKAVDLHEGIDSTLMILQYRLKRSPESPGIRINTCYQPLPLVECYPSAINQVFMNVIANAIDALEEVLERGDRSEPGLITIHTSLNSDRQEGPCAVVRIVDNGPGIPEHQISQLFDPFFTTKPVGKGTGLGLSISYQIIVEQHNGYLYCLSQVGKGTEFRLEIPLHMALSAPAPRLGEATGLEQHSPACRISAS